MIGQPQNESWHFRFPGCEGPGAEQSNCMRQMGGGHPTKHPFSAGSGWRLTNFGALGMSCAAPEWRRAPAKRARTDARRTPTAVRCDVLWKPISGEHHQLCRLRSSSAMPGEISTKPGRGLPSLGSVPPLSARFADPAVSSSADFGRSGPTLRRLRPSVGEVGNLWGRIRWMSGEVNRC